MFRGKIGKELMIQQGYVPRTCTLSDEIAGPLIYSEVNAGRDPCSDCNANRSVCHGRENKQQSIGLSNKLGDEYWF